MNRFCLSGLLLFAMAVVSVESDGAVRKPAVAGSFYPADSAQLTSMLRNHLAAAAAQPKDGQLIALIVPHAGLVYSGAIAARGYKLLESAKPDRVILCGPSHRFGFSGISIYGPGIVWETPLGSVPCDPDLVEQMLSYDPRVAVVEQAHVAEHSLEVQLPYLQIVLDSFTIVPALMGRQDRETIKLMADALTALTVPDNTVIVAATDWQHFRSAAKGWPMDSLGIECIKDLDASRLERLIQSGAVEACGGGPTVAVLRAAASRGADRVKILAYGDSGDVSGDKSSVVGYLAAAIYKSADRTAITKESEAEKSGPSATDRARLLEIARRSIEAHLAGESIPGFHVSDALKEPGAAFVTLNKQGRLRGCIGYTAAVQPLYQTVSECAISAAVRDTRFPPVTSAELDELEIEISVLTPLRKLESIDEIVVGRDGLMMTLGNRRGLLLPQVATDYGWTRTEFLQQTCRKAGLSPNAYLAENAVIYTFQAIVFGESEH
jgi:AmmeMemoRadiSam system protein B/AmmeMemoRadiSam system protein A